MVLILYLFLGPLLDQSLKKISNFLSEAIKDAKLLFSSVTFRTYIFHSVNHDADRRPPVFIGFESAIEDTSVELRRFSET